MSFSSMLMVRSSLLNGILIGFHSNGLHSASTVLGVFVSQYRAAGEWRRSTLSTIFFPDGGLRSRRSLALIRSRGPSSYHTFWEMDYRFFLLNWISQNKPASERWKLIAR